MAPNWKFIKTLISAKCHGCKQNKFEGNLHLGTHEFLCDGCYIEKHVSLERLKPLPQFHPFEKPQVYAWEIVQKWMQEAAAVIGTAFRWIRNRLIQTPLFN